MTLITFADPNVELEQLASALEGRGAPLAIAPEDTLGAAANGPAAETASALIASERLLVERRPAAVIVAGGSNRVLAAALAASKLEIPLISFPTKTVAGDADAERNARLLRLLADLVVEVDEKDPAGTIHAWLQSASPRSARTPATG